MLSKDDIIFEEDLYTHSHIHSQEEVKDALVELVKAFVVELGIKRLDRVIVKKTDFFDTELGIANYKTYTIALANNIAYCLADKNARFYLRSLAVLKHELYHFQVFQNLRINEICKRITEPNTEKSDAFHYLSEFFASFSTFDLYEDDNLYTSFKSTFKKPFATDEEKKYYTCRLLGYYLHDNHSEMCDELVNEYLSHDAIEETTNSFKSVLQSYPFFSDDQLRNIGYAVNKVIIKKETPPKYTLVPKKDLWWHVLSKSKDIQ